MISITQGHECRTVKYMKCPACGILAHMGANFTSGWQRGMVFLGCPWCKHEWEEPDTKEHNS